MCSHGINTSVRQYYFFLVVSHKHLTEFCAKYIDLNLSFWECLFNENFLNLRVLNLALSCNDFILKLVPKYCPQLEYLNATSKYVCSNYSRGRPDSNLRLQLSVTDTGLSYLQECQKLKTLVINEPRGEELLLMNQTSYDGIRLLLRTVKTLEDISYSNIGYVLSNKLEDVNHLNLTVVRHLDPTEATLKEIFRLCRNIKKLNLINYAFESSVEMCEQLCSAPCKFKEIEFQNIHIGHQFEQFFEKFGENLTSISLSYTRSELTFSQIVTIGNYCPSLKFFLCNHLMDQQYVPNFVKNYTDTKILAPFSQLESLFISGCNIAIDVVVKYCTEYAVNLKILKIHERISINFIDEMLLQFINSRNLRQMELSRRLLCTKAGIEKIIEKYHRLNFLKVHSRDNCTDLLKSMNSQNYDFVLIVNNSHSDSFFLE